MEQQPQVPQKSTSTSKVTCITIIIVTIFMFGVSTIVGILAFQMGKDTVVCTDSDSTDTAVDETTDNNDQEPVIDDPEEPEDISNDPIDTSQLSILSLIQHSITDIGIAFETEVTESANGTSSLWFHSDDYQITVNADTDGKPTDVAIAPISMGKCKEDSSVLYDAEEILKFVGLDPQDVGEPKSEDSSHDSGYIYYTDYQGYPLGINCAINGYYNISMRQFVKFVLDE